MDQKRKRDEDMDPNPQFTKYRRIGLLFHFFFFFEIGFISFFVGDVLYCTCPCDCVNVTYQEWPEWELCDDCDDCAHFEFIENSKNVKGE